MISISLCMIVKNEERVLARCLDSLQGLMDEIIIVDTGSTDGTREIAARYTDRIYDYVWRDDFADARNFSFSKATGDYIYVADADEVLDPENRERFRKLKQVLLPEIDIVQMQYCNQMQYNTTYNFDMEYRPKLYKRVRQFVWQDPIHESVRLDPVVYDSDIAILHLPESNHGPRDFQVFQRMWERGEQFSKKLHNMYARELMIAGQAQDFFDAEAFFLQSLKDTTRSEDELREGIVILAHGYRLRRDVVQFFKYTAKALVMEPCSEICYELGEFYKEQKDYEEASNWYLNAMEGTEAILSIKYQQELPKQGLLACYQELEQMARQRGDLEVAESYRLAYGSLFDSKMQERVEE